MGVLGLLAVLLGSPGCFSLCSLLPPLPSATCTTVVAVSALAATDAGAASVTVSCNQGPSSACDGGSPPPCPVNVCVEVDWVSVSSGYNGNCSAAGTPQALATGAQCVPFGGTSVAMAFDAPASVPVPFLVYAHAADGGGNPVCDSTCAQQAVTCACDESLAGTPGQSCATLK
jgi:hypothetical protein